ncbi:hypothetical protein C5142_08770 [Rhodococcus sp. BGS-1C]
MVRGIPQPGRSLADVYPEQAREWHPTRNDRVPQQVTPRSNRRVWWLCDECGEEFQSTVANRTSNASQGCRACATQRRRAQATFAGPGASLLERFPDLAAQLHSTKNGERTAASIRPNMRAKIWWHCSDCGHEWEMPPRTRTASPFSGCPPCSWRRAGRILRTPSPGKSLADLRPSVSSQWHPTKNGKQQPSDVTLSSGTRAWWLCDDPDCGHVWQTSVANRTTGKKTGCPKCSRAQSNSPAPGGSLAEHPSGVIAEWHPSKNGSLDPGHIKPGSSAAKVWWVCTHCAHEWEATPASRTSAGTGCSPCSYRTRIALRDVPKPGQSLAEKFPNLLLEWDKSRNERRPEDLKTGSDINAWWICSARGHQWQARIYTRTGSDRTGCPECMHLPDPGHSAADTYPHLVAQFQPDKNPDRTLDEFKPGSAVKVWWTCQAQGHEWQASISNRASGTGCPKCTMWGISEQEIRLRYELAAAGCPVDHDHERIPVNGRPSVNADIVMPSWRLVVEFDGSLYHAGTAAQARDVRQTDALVAAGWAVIRARHAPLDLLTAHDVVVGTNSDAKRMALTVLHKINELGFRPVYADDYRNDPAPWGTAAADAVVYRHHKRSLSTLFPQIAAEWHPSANDDRRPELTNPGSRLRTWWKCAACAHEWATAIKHRTSEGSGCPMCARAMSGLASRTPRAGQSAADLNPQLLDIFDPMHNGSTTLFDVKPSSWIEFWWRCPTCDHRWKTRPRSPGCRPCAARARGIERSTPPPGQSFADLHPKFAAQWHSTMNGELKPHEFNPGSGTVIWWLCGDCGNVWQRSIAGRTLNESGCRACSSVERGKRKRMPSSGRSLTDLHPKLAAEWDAARNSGLTPGSVKPGSSERVWWKCGRCGHSWQALIWARARKGHGCRKCAGKVISKLRSAPKPGASLAEVKPELVKRLWHPDRNPDMHPSDLTPNSHTRVWWRCPDCGHEWHAAPGSNPGCDPCGAKRTAAKLRTVKPGNSLAEKAPKVAAQWHPTRNGDVKPNGINAGTSDNYWWLCESCQHEWRARPTNRTRQAYLCPRCKTAMQ